MGIEVEEMEKARTRKRPRLGWDVAPAGPEAQRALVTARRSSPPKRDDDHEGHYVFNLGENLTPRYKILSKMGEAKIASVVGTFGRVLECWDRQTRQYVAIKVFEKLGPSLFDFLKRNKYNPFPVDLVREFGRQLLESVAYMHDLHLIHTDLKPENILLVSSEYVKLPGYKRSSSDETHFRCLPKSSAIKLIDFGSTAYDNQNHSSIISTRHYRAPEVGLIHVIYGVLVAYLLNYARRGAEKYFRRGSRLNWPEGAVSRESIRAVKKLDRLKNIVSQHVDSSRNSLSDLLEGLLKYDPAERLTARQALNHPFFKNELRN
ncbi:hypothetical protein COLO4_18711 [Corchorus olitorius]|uniref:Protein kinase domain-containing protein n=1 Tax=Corchorus olitorius TaxID=93759 RepID=A0A1R3J838_9ROSI|nr:hypothetical protein COLO4_18711 [Corchorus olitorius]